MTATPPSPAQLGKLAALGYQGPRPTSFAEATAVLARLLLPPAVVTEGAPGSGNRWEPTPRKPITPLRLPLQEPRQKPKVKQAKRSPFQQWVAWCWYDLYPGEDRNPARVAAILGRKHNPLPLAARNRLTDRNPTDEDLATLRQAFGRFVRNGHASGAWSQHIRNGKEPTQPPNTNPASASLTGRSPGGSGGPARTTPASSRAATS